MAVLVAVLGLITLALLIGARALALSFKEQPAMKGTRLPDALTGARPLPSPAVRQPIPAEEECLAGGGVV